MIRKSKSLGIFLTFALIFISGAIFSHSVKASDRYELISNTVYLNKGSMTKSQIQSFLESKKSALATYKDQGINDSKKELASTIIYNAAQAWGINPQVIIATLQKEQSLITKQNPTSIDYRSAMGYGCPDSSACNSLYYGFANQVNIASYQFRYNYEALKGNKNFIDGDGDRHNVGAFACNQSTGFYNRPLLPGSTVTFKRNTAISGTKDRTVTIANEATASLLCYTPHVGPYATTGYSGSDNFVYWFQQWFGSTTVTVKGGIGERYQALGGSTGFLGEPLANERCGLVRGGCYQVFQGGSIYWSSGTGAHSVSGGILSRWAALKYEAGVLGYPTQAEISLGNGQSYQQFQSGRIYWKNSLGTFSARGGIGEKYLNYGASVSTLGFPRNEEQCGLAQGGCSQDFEGGSIYWSSKTNTKVIKGGLQSKWAALGAQNGRLGYPATDEICGLKEGRCVQLFQNGRLYWTIAGGIPVWGGIVDRYNALNADLGLAGFPTSSESCGLKSGGCVQSFENGTIVWSQASGPWESQGGIRAYWLNIGGIDSYMGYPTGGIQCGLPRSGCLQDYQVGRIYWTGALGTYNVRGAILTKYKLLGAHNSKLGYPIGEETSSNAVASQKFEHGTIHWTAQKGTWLQ